MLIFFGIRTSKLGRFRVQNGSSCPHCENSHSLEVVKYGSYFHIFWIPIVALGSKKVIACNHCRKEFEEQNTESSVDSKVFTALDQQATKGRWRNLGCFVILTFVALTLLFVIFASVVKAFDSDDEVFEYEQNSQENDREEIREELVYEYIDHRARWRVLLEKDLRNTDYYPDSIHQPHSFAFKKCFETAMNMSREKTACLVKRNSNNVLILFEINDFIDFSNSKKNKAYKTIDACISQLYSVKEDSIFVAVGTPGQVFMQKTPSGMVKDTTANSSELLKEFYQPSVKKD